MDWWGRRPPPLAKRQAIKERRNGPHHRWRTARLPSTQQHAAKDVHGQHQPPRDGNTIPLRNGEQEKQSMPRGRQPIGEHALSNAERQARYRARREVEQPLPKIRYRRPADRRTRAQRWFATPSPGWSRCKPSMPRGMTRCPTACATVPPPRPFRPSSISTSIHSSQSCHRVATGAIDPQRNQRCTR